MLQILLLTEKEATALIGIVHQVALSAGVGEMERNQEIEQFGQDTPIDKVARDINKSCLKNHKRKCLRDDRCRIIPVTPTRGYE
jgi:hypothetical protein